VAIEPANELRGVKPVSSVESLHWLCCMDRRQISTQAQTVSDNLRHSQINFKLSSVLPKKQK
jgi:hypothetical protein